MSKDAEKIFFGPADVTLYDATNGYLFCGYLDRVQVSAKPTAHIILDGNARQYAKAYQFRARLQQSDQALVDALVTRQSTRQTIYITGINNQVVLSNMFIGSAEDMSFLAEDTHGVSIYARTNVLSDVLKKQNIIGKDGKFEVDTNSDGLADGWTAAVTTKSVGASHLSGGGNQQNIKIVSGGQYILKDIIAPFESPRRITASAYIVERGGLDPADFTFGFKLLNSAGTVVQYESATVSIPVSTSSRVTLSSIVGPSDQIVTIRPIIEYNAAGYADIGIDNYMVEFGNLTAFSDN